MVSLVVHSDDKCIDEITFVLLMTIFINRKNKFFLSFLFTSHNKKRYALYVYFYLYRVTITGRSCSLISRLPRPKLDIFRRPRPKFGTYVINIIQTQILQQKKKKQLSTLADGNFLSKNDLHILIDFIYDSVFSNEQVDSKPISSFGSVTGSK